MKMSVPNTTHSQIITTYKVLQPNPVYWDWDSKQGERTQWFPWNVRPVRVGWYELRGPCVDAATPMFWNGTQWGYWMPHPADDNQLWVHWADDDKDQWRGLANKP